MPSSERFFTEVKKRFQDAYRAGPGFVVFDYVVPIGGRAGSRVKLGLAEVPDWPLSCPSGPHVSPRIGHPGGNVHPSPLGTDWEYWSRPFPGWAASQRTLKAYMAHVRALLEQLP
jgi:hypothetical protein